MNHQLFTGAEEIVLATAEWVKLGVETIGVGIILWGICFSLFQYGGQLFGKSDDDYVPLRLSLSRYLVVALEFQLAADILGTAIAPDWSAIGKLAAIAVIRTVLNYFLGKEIDKEVEMERSGRNDQLAERMDK